MKQIGISGHLGNSMDGQTIKTRIYTKELTRIFTSNEIQLMDLQGGPRKLFVHIWNICKLIAACKNIIIFPAHNAVRVLGPLLAFMNIFYKRNLHYVVIGGWLPQFLRTRKYLLHSLLKFNYIYVETSTMKSNLEKMGFTNIVILPNCKDLHILHQEELVSTFAEPYRLCTLSRINQEKGIEEAIKVVCEINQKLGRTALSLDIYGPIAKDYEESFHSIIQNIPEYIQYKGSVAFDKTVETLKEYYALLFPTHYYTEGIPGTIIDAYSAGVPVISAKWESFADLIENNVVGKGYEFDNYHELKEILLHLLDNPDELIRMKPNCLRKAHLFSAETVIHKLAEKLV